VKKIRVNFVRFGILFVVFPNHQYFPPAFESVGCPASFPRAKTSPPSTPQSDSRTRDSRKAGGNVGIGDEGHAVSLR